MAGRKSSPINRLATLDVVKARDRGDELPSSFNDKPCAMHRCFQPAFTFACSKLTDANITNLLWKDTSSCS